MFVALCVTTGLLSAALVGSALGKLTRAPAIVKQMDALGVPHSWLPFLATAEIAGAAGMMIGLAVVPVSVAAAIGVVLYFVGAVGSHVRVGERNVVAPVVLAGLATAVIFLRLATI